jgi:hypothetical protein
MTLTAVDGGAVPGRRHAWLFVGDVVAGWGATHRCIECGMERRPRRYPSGVQMPPPAEYRMPGGEWTARAESGPCVDT